MFRIPHIGWTLAAGVIALLLLAPILFLAYLAASSGLEEFWNALRASASKAMLTTILLMAGVAFLTAVTGTGLAYLITFFRFPGRRYLAWLVVLPLALPPYIAAYGFVEFTDYSGPIQSGLRWILSNTTMADLDRRILSRDYWFPDFTSLGGAVFMLSAILYPYVYLTVRATFAMQGAHVAEVARTLGASTWTVAVRIVLPLAAPAILLGVILCLMETLNDIGAVTYLGVFTLTHQIENVWINRGSLGGAAAIALLLFAVVLMLIILEQVARRGTAFFEHRTGRGQISLYPVTIAGAKGWAITALCLLPPLIGLGAPLYVHIRAAANRLSFFSNPDLWASVGTSLTFAAWATALTLTFAIILVYTTRLNTSASLRYFLKTASVGYAIPGTMIGIGLLILTLRLDNFIDARTEAWFGYNWGLFLRDSGFALVVGYSVRFMALGQGGIESALARVSPNLDDASRTLGRGSLRTLLTVILPVIWPALLMAGLLVFIDSIKELSATMMLQPVGFETLSMRIFNHAEAGNVERTGPGSLVMIALAMIPTLIVAHQLERRISNQGLNRS